MTFRFNSWRRWIVCVGVMTLFIGHVLSQTIVGYASFYDDAFNRWEILTDDPELTGSIELTYGFNQDFSDWQFSLGNASGWIRLRNKRDPNVWEVVGNGDLIQVRTVYPNEFNHWQISDGRITVDVKNVRFQPDVWEVTKTRTPLLSLYTYYEGDLRDWVIESSTDLSVAMQIACTFIPIIQVIPKH